MMYAGRVYNTWPLMDGGIVPAGLGDMSPWLINLFENAATVQFDHRMVAYAILIWVGVQFFAVRQSPELIDIPVGVRIFAFAVLLQIGLGIAALLLHVPIHIALAHQAVAVVTFAAGIYHLRRLSDLSA